MKSSSQSIQSEMKYFIIGILAGAALAIGAVMLQSAVVKNIQASLLGSYSYLYYYTAPTYTLSPSLVQMGGQPN